MTVQLRAPILSDIDARIALGRSREIIRMYGDLVETPTAITRSQAEAWFERLSAHPCAWAIAVEDDLVGEARLDNINKDDRHARLAIGLFNERHLGHGIGRRAVKLVLQHAFDQLNLHRVDLRVLSYNPRAIRCYEACGFVREGVERETALVGGVWYDDWIMAILEHEFRSISQQ